MGGTSRKQCIDAFVRWLQEPFVNVFPVSTDRAAQIAADHFPAVRGITDEMVSEVIAIMQRSITAHSDHHRIREWKRCCRGVADYILRPAEIDGAHRLIAAGVLVRLSGYIHHCPAFFADFRPAAERMDEVMQLHLPYLKTGGAVTIDTDCVDAEGYITLWNFAKGAKTEVARSESEIRALASRILNFICLHRYPNVRVKQRSYEAIELAFSRDERTLYRWAVSDKTVDFLALRLQVPADDLYAFLFPPDQPEDNLEAIFEEEDFTAPSPRPGPAFNPSQTYKPDRDRRYTWFKNEWNVV